MTEQVQQERTLSFISNVELLRLKLEAIRRGVWFRALPRIDRVLFDLTLRIGKDVRSSRLARSILQVAGKIREMLVSKLALATREVGFASARKLSEIATAWGNVTAKAWLNDLRFARFLAMMHLNRLGSFNT